jgi:hypothetical protein
MYTYKSVAYACIYVFHYNVETPGVISTKLLHQGMILNNNNNNTKWICIITITSIIVQSMVFGIAEMNLNTPYAV